MPNKAPHPCASLGCPETTLTRYCERHQHLAIRVDNRPSAGQRGYNTNWQRIRARVLREYGIPSDLWALYDIHHSPAYDPAVDPDHKHYALTPVLHEHHSQHTATIAGGFGNRRETTMLNHQANEMR